MRHGLLALLAVVLAAGALAAPAGAAARGPLIAIGDQKADMFDDPRLAWLGIRKARLVVPWYTASIGTAQEKALVDEWLQAARRRGIQPLVGFGHGWVGWTRLYLPSVREYRRAVRAFRLRYPWVRDYITWNEANHCSQPTCQRPERVARYYDALKSSCPRCRVLAAAVLTAGNMSTWLRRFERAARHRARLWGLHNYGDVNRLRWSGTRTFLRRVRGKVWITETGGVVYRAKYGGQDPFPVGARRAGRVTRYLLRMARRTRRIARVYLYHWNVDRPRPQWDSGLLDWAGRGRASFRVIARALGRDPRRAPRPAAAAASEPVAPPPPPAPEAAGGGTQQEQAEPAPDPSASGDPAAAEPQEEQCSLVLLCPPVPLAPRV
ncbi:MAG TPA: hypothetical protein VGW75_00735 [Solirubrobacteraceae bacterium]|jgi:hypothetical protein|nr:hypothetical protein [Solirubrobacteraceae bacterium]